MRRPHNTVIGRITRLLRGKNAQKSPLWDCFGLHLMIESAEKTVAALIECSVIQRYENQRPGF